MPEATLIEIEPGECLLYSRKAFFAGGMDGYTQPPAQNEDLFEALENVLPAKDGQFHKRWGTNRFDGTPAITLATRHFIEYRDLAATKQRLICAGTEGATRKVKTVDADGVVKNTGVFTVASTTDNPRAAISRDFAHFASGSANDRVKYDGNDVAGSGTTTWGITAPTGAVVASASGTGTFTISFWRDYTVAFENTATGHISEFGPFTRVAAFKKKAQVDVSVVPTGAATEGGINTGTNSRVILATSDGGGRDRLYLLGRIADNTTTTFTDSILEATLLNAAVYSEIDQDGTKRGVLDNARPPSTGKFPVKHRGRIYLLDNGVLRFSKSLDEVSTSTDFEIGGNYEECWPAEYAMELGFPSEDSTGLHSDGTFLYILTKNTVYRLWGDGPLNFLPPEALHKHTGVVSNDVFTTVYRGGQPAGFAWYTPDRQLLLSDGPTYTNIGFEVKTELDAASLANSRLAFFAYEGYNFLCFTDGNAISKWLLYHLDSNKWVTWQLALTNDWRTVTALHYWTNPSTNASQLVFGTGGTQEKLGKIDKTVATDGDGVTTATPSAVLRTPWLAFGSSDIRKFLNSLEALTSASGADFTVRIEGASTEAEFTTPTSVVAAGTQLTASPAGDQFLALAGLSTKDKFYRLQFTITAASLSTVRVFGGYSLEVAPISEV